MSCSARSPFELRDLLIESGLVIFAQGHECAFGVSVTKENIPKLPLQYVNCWFCNEIEGEALFRSDDPEKIAENFIKKYPNRNLILTLGSKGCLFKNKDLNLKQPIYEAKVVDTTAAGDTFTGYFLAAVINGKSIEYALDLASKASSVTVSRKGAAESIPYLNEIS